MLIKDTKVEFVDDGPGKPVGINRFIGRRPLMAFGSSDGDYHMLQWTTSGPGPRFGLLVHHTDADREYAYDWQSHVGKLDRALSEAPGRGWVVVDMKRDRKTVFPTSAGGRRRSVGDPFRTLMDLACWPASCPKCDRNILIFKTIQDDAR